jgi:hypothetical protein
MRREQIDVEEKGRKRGEKKRKKKGHTYPFLS